MPPRHQATYTDQDGYTVTVRAYPEMIRGNRISPDDHGKRRGEFLILHPDGRVVRSGWWMGYPEPDWVRNGVNLRSEWDAWFRGEVSATPSWYDIPVDEMLRREAEQQATAYRPLREQFAERWAEGDRWRVTSGTALAGGR